MTEVQTQRDKAVALLIQRTMMRAHELKAEGVTAATLARAVRDGEIIRAGRGLYQLPDGGDSAHMALAQVSKRIPDGVMHLDWRNAGVA